MFSFFCRLTSAFGNLPWAECSPTAVEVRSCCQRKIDCTIRGVFLWESANQDAIETLLGFLLGQSYFCVGCLLEENLKIDCWPWKYNHNCRIQFKTGLAGHSTTSRLDLVIWSSEDRYIVTVNQQHKDVPLEIPRAECWSRTWASLHAIWICGFFFAINKQGRRMRDLPVCIHWKNVASFCPNCVHKVLVRVQIWKLSIHLDTNSGKCHNRVGVVPCM